MRQTKYLFVGGPLDGQWREVAGEPGLMVAQANTSAEDTANMVRYRRVPLSLPGWSVVIAVYVAEGVAAWHPGVPLPGYTSSGGWGERSTLPGNWRDHGYHTNAMWTKIRARGYRP